jgi:hypothetical protein
LTLSAGNCPLEIDFIGIQQKEFELQGLAEGEDSNNSHKLLESQLKILKDKAAVFSDCKFKAAQALDTQIGLIQEAEMKEMDDAVAKFKRIVVVSL